MMRVGLGALVLAAGVKEAGHPVNSKIDFTPVLPPGVPLSEGVPLNMYTTNSPSKPGSDDGSDKTIDKIYTALLEGGLQLQRPFYTKTKIQRFLEGTTNAFVFHRRSAHATDKFKQNIIEQLKQLPFSTKVLCIPKRMQNGKDIVEFIVINDKFAKEGLIEKLKLQSSSQYTRDRWYQAAAMSYSTEKPYFSETSILQDLFDGYIELGALCGIPEENIQDKRLYAIVRMFSMLREISGQPGDLIGNREFPGLHEFTQANQDMIIEIAESKGIKSRNVWEIMNAIGKISRNDASPLQIIETYTQHGIHFQTYQFQGHTIGLQPRQQKVCDEFANGYEYLEKLAKQRG